MTGVTGTGAISIINKVNKHRKHLIRKLFDGVFMIGTCVTELSYRLSASFKNQFGRVITINIPIKQPGEMGPKPIIAKTENTERHFNWALFMAIIGPIRYIEFKETSIHQNWPPVHYKIPQHQ